MACVLYGISGWVIGHLIRGRAGAERRAANPGRRCWPTTRLAAAFAFWNWRSVGGGALRQSPPLAAGWPEGWQSAGLRASGFSELAEHEGSLNLLGKGPRFPYTLAVFSCAREGPSASGFDPAAPARTYRVGFGTTRSKPLAEGGRGACALWHFRLGDRPLDPRPRGRERRAANPGRRCRPTTRLAAAFPFWIGDRPWRSFRQSPPLAAAGRRANIRLGSALWISELAEHERSLNLLGKGPRFHTRSPFLCAREGPSASGLIGRRRRGPIG